MALTQASYSMITGAVGNVLDFGADATGATSSSSAFAAALAAYTTVYIPQGQYKLTTTLTVARKKLIGDGPEAVTLTYTGSSSAINASGTDAQNCHLEGFKLVGTASASAGILISEASVGCRRGIFKNIYVTGFTGSGAFGVDLAASLNNGIYYNYFERVDCIANDYGFRVYSSDGATNGYRCNSNTFVSCDASQNVSGNGVRVDYGSGNTFVGLNCESNGAAGVYLGYTYETTFCGGFSENNTAALNVSANAVRVHYYGRRTIDSIVGTTNSASSFFTTDDFTVDASGNIAATSIATSAELPIQNTVAKIYAGGSTPNGRITASPGSLFLYTGGGASTTLWVKESGTGDVGWVAK